MNTRYLPVLICALTLLGAGCSAPYGLGYNALLDPKDARLIQGRNIEHHWVADMHVDAMARYREGYAMVGYSYLIGAHLRAVAPQAAKNWGRKLDAEQVLQYQNGRLYLATYWRKVRGFSLGAYYEDPPPSARERTGLPTGVIVQDVVDGTPAHYASLMPGDLLLALNDTPIADARWLDQALTEHAGQRVKLTVWPMVAIGPMNLTLTLADAAPHGDAR